MGLRFKRIMLKISGEALSAKQGFGINSEVLGNISDKVKSAWDLGIEIGIVVGEGATSGEAVAVMIWIELLQTIWECSLLL